MRQVGYVLEKKADTSIVYLYRLLGQAKAALINLPANEYRIIAISEYQGYKFEGPHMYYIQYDGSRFIKYN